MTTVRLASEVHAFLQDIFLLPELVSSTFQQQGHHSDQLVPLILPKLDHTPFCREPVRHLVESPLFRPPAQYSTSSSAQALRTRGFQPSSIGSQDMSHEQPNPLAPSPPSAMPVPSIQDVQADRPWLAEYAADQEGYSPQSPEESIQHDRLCDIPAGHGIQAGSDVRTRPGLSDHHAWPMPASDLMPASVAAACQRSADAHSTPQQVDGMDGHDAMEISASPALSFSQPSLVAVHSRLAGNCSSPYPCQDLLCSPQDSNMQQRTTTPMVHAGPEAGGMSDSACAIPSAGGLSKISLLPEGFSWPPMRPMQTPRADITMEERSRIPFPLAGLPHAAALPPAVPMTAAGQTLPSLGQPQTPQPADALENPFAVDDVLMQMCEDFMGVSTDLTPMFATGDTAGFPATEPGKDNEASISHSLAVMSAAHHTQSDPLQHFGSCKSFLGICNEVGPVIEPRTSIDQSNVSGTSDSFAMSMPPAWTASPGTQPSVEPSSRCRAMPDIASQGDYCERCPLGADVSPPSRIDSSLSFDSLASSSLVPAGSPTHVPDRSACGRHPIPAFAPDSLSHELPWCDTRPPIGHDEQRMRILAEDLSSRHPMHGTRAVRAGSASQQTRQQQPQVGRGHVLSSRVLQLPSYSSMQAPPDACKSQHPIVGRSEGCIADRTQFPHLDMFLHASDEPVLHGSQPKVRMRFCEERRPTYEPACQPPQVQGTHGRRKAGIEGAQTTRQRNTSADAVDWSQYWPPNAAKERAKKARASAKPQSNVMPAKAARYHGADLPFFTKPLHEGQEWHGQQSAVANGPRQPQSDVPVQPARDSFPTPAMPLGSNCQRSMSEEQVLHSGSRKRRMESAVPSEAAARYRDTSAIATNLAVHQAKAIVASRVSAGSTNPAGSSLHMMRRANRATQLAAQTDCYGHTHTNASVPQAGRVAELFSQHHPQMHFQQPADYGAVPNQVSAGLDHHHHQHQRQPFQSRPSSQSCQDRTMSLQQRSLDAASRSSSAQRLLALGIHRDQRVYSGGVPDGQVLLSSIPSA